MELFFFFKLGFEKRFTFERIILNNNKNIVLIGMPGSGKTTIGKMLAVSLDKAFLDTDNLIEKQYGATLQTIINHFDYLTLRQYEETVITGLQVQNSVIATGGSAVYSEKSMAVLSKNSKIVYLQLQIPDLLKRIRNFQTRGIAKAADQTFEDLFKERELLYKKYANISINCEGKGKTQILNELLTKLTY